MAKKSFKGGLGSLLESTVKKTEDEELAQAEEALGNEHLVAQLRLAREELYLWRQGLLTVELFNQSLLAQKLYYDAKTNQIHRKEH